MRIGIISMQRVANYGSFLQAYGLKKTIEELGHEVSFIDYKVEPCIGKSGFRGTKAYLQIKNMLRVIRKKMIQANLYHVKHEVTRNILRFTYTYEDQYLPMLGMDKKKHYHTPVDAVVLGSDEIFNCLQDNDDVGFSRELFGVNQNAQKIITYAASFGNTTVKRLEEYGAAETVQHWLEKIQNFSARDKNTIDVLEKLTKKTPEYHLDPVLISDFSDEITLQVQLKDYIIVYAYPGRITPQEAEAIKAYAKKTNKKLLCLGGYLDFCDEYRICTPFDVLAYFREADCIITDTFHGSIFSIITNRPFATLVRPTRNHSYGNEEKLTDLLSRLGLTERICYQIQDVWNILEKPIDYTKTNDIIRNEKIRSREYLKKSLAN